MDPARKQTRRLSSLLLAFNKKQKNVSNILLNCGSLLQNSDVYDLNQMIAIN